MSTQQQQPYCRDCDSKLTKIDFSSVFIIQLTQKMFNKNLNVYYGLWLRDLDKLSVYEITMFFFFSNVQNKS